MDYVYRGQSHRTQQKRRLAIIANSNMTYDFSMATSGKRVVSRLAVFSFLCSADVFSPSALALTYTGHVVRSYTFHRRRRRRNRRHRRQDEIILGIFTPRRGRVHTFGAIHRKFH